MTEVPGNRKLILKYSNGQFTFRSFNNAATDAQMHDLAMRLNAFQSNSVSKVIKVRTFAF
ncbi:MAG: hypothetical protein FWD19_01080 [Defluviitaleaceae bacterium]|nr:hypothetical protein [Defluviitaleaceae bacterium]